MFVVFSLYICILAYLWLVPHPTVFMTLLQNHGMYVYVCVCVCVYAYVCM